jgi:hypothetical protein
MHFMGKITVLLAALLALFGSAEAKPKQKRKISSPQKVERKGMIERGTFAPGSKSESEAVFLVMGDGEKLKLRTPEQNPFEVDPALAELVGHRASCIGVLIDAEFINAACKAIE